MNSAGGCAKQSGGCLGGCLVAPLWLGLLTAIVAHFERASFLQLHVLAFLHALVLVPLIIGALRKKVLWGIVVGYLFCITGFLNRNEIQQQITPNSEYSWEE